MSRLPATMLLLIVVLGCARSERTQTTDTTSVVSTSERTASEGVMERRLGDLGARIDSLALRVDATQGRAKAEMQQELDSLTVKREQAKRKLAELKEAADARWDRLRHEMADVLDAIDGRIERASDALRDGGSR